MLINDVVNFKQPAPAFPVSAYLIMVIVTGVPARLRLISLLGWSQVPAFSETRANPRIPSRKLFQERSKSVKLCLH